VFEKLQGDKKKEKEKKQKKSVTLLSSFFKKNQIFAMPDLRNSLMNEVKQQTDKQ